MPHSLRAKLSGLRYKGIIEDKDYKRLCHALDLEKAEQQPCDDAISRQAVIDTLNKTSGIRGDALKALYELPPVTPQQKYGKWIKHPEIETSTPEYLMFYECSECGDKQCFCKSDLHKKRFCNSCGAKMQESEK